MGKAKNIIIKAAIAAALTAAFGPAGGFTIFGTQIGVAASIGLSAIGSVVMGALSAALAPKIKQPNLASFAVRQVDQTTLIRQPITPWRFLYGEALISGPLTFFESTDDNKFHHMVITLGHREYQAIKAVYFDDVPIYDADLDGDGNVISGKFSGKVRIKKHLGGAGQVADADLIAAINGIDSNFKGIDCPYIYVRIQTDRDLFPGVIPGNIKVWAKGIKTFDTRDSGTRWSPNSSLGIRDYLTNVTLGRRVATVDINDATVTSAANICEEMVATKAVSHDVETVDTTDDFLDLNLDRLKFFTGDRVQVTTTDTLPAGISAATNYFIIHIHELKTDNQKPRIQLAATYANALAEVAIDITDAGSGTHTVTRNAEPRYTLNGIVDTATRPSDILEEMRWSMAGFVPHNGPSWSVLAGAYVAPTLIFDEGDLRGPISRRGKHSRRDRFNAVKGVYATHLNAGQATDYPIITSSTYQTADGGDRIFRELDLPFTNRPGTAKRIAKIALERHRQEQTFDATFSLGAFQIQAGDNVGITNARRSWTDKAFFVESWGFKVDDNPDGPALLVLASLRETSSTIYDWDETTEEVIVEPAPLQSPLDPTVVGNPTNLTLASGTAQLDKRLDGTIFSHIKITWTKPLDEYVVSGGRIEIQNKKSADSTWLPHRFVDGVIVEDFILDVKDGTAYDVRIRSVNQLGIRASTWLTVSSHTVVGKTELPSNVELLSVQQNGELMTSKWLAISDLDRDGYELRYMAAPFIWASAILISEETKGTLVTNAAVPPGTWVIGIKAIDTSGNYSTNAKTATITLSNDNDIVATTTEHPRWTGTITDFIRHDVSGTLVPDSNTLASAMTDAQLWDQMVYDPVATAVYEAKEIDLGFDADGVRVFAEMDGVIGPGESGIANPELSIDFRDEADSYDGFEGWPTASLADFRRLKMRVTITTATGVAALKEFTTIADVAERTETGTATILIGGTTITFAQRFHTTPNIQVTPSGGSAVFPVKSNESVTSFDVTVYNSSGTDVGGTVDWQAIGA